MSDRPNPAEHLKLARWAVDRFLRRRPWLEHLREDLIAAVVAEFCEAARHFDAARGAWSSLAVTAAEHAILHEIRRIGGPVRTPGGKRTAQTVSLDEDHGYEAEAVPAHELRLVRREDMPDRPHALLDVLRAEGSTPEQAAMAAEAPRLLEALGEREQDLIARRMGGETLEEIGESIGRTRERVRQIELKALRRLREKYGRR